MGTYTVGSNPIQVSQAATDPSLLINMGDDIIYLDKATSVSPINAGLTLYPKQSVKWQGGELYAMSVTGSTLSQMIGADGTVLPFSTVVVDGPVDINGAVTIDGPVDVTGTVAVDGPVTVTGDVGVTGPVSVTGDVGVTGPVSVTGDVGITGPVSVTGDVGVTGAVTVSGDVGVTGPVSVTGDVGVTGPVSVTGDVGITGPVAVTGDVGVTGTVGITGPVSVDGAVSIDGPVGISGPVTVDGSVLVGGGIIQVDGGVIDIGSPVLTAGSLDLIKTWIGTFTTFGPPATAHEVTSYRTLIFAGSLARTSGVFRNSVRFSARWKTAPLGATIVTEYFDVQLPSPAATFYVRLAVKGPYAELGMSSAFSADWDAAVYVYGSSTESPEFFFTPSGTGSTEAIKRLQSFAFASIPINGTASVDLSSIAGTFKCTINYPVLGNANGAYVVLKEVGTGSVIAGGRYFSTGAPWVIELTGISPRSPMYLEIKNDTAQVTGSFAGTIAYQETGA